jgi:aminoglycoside N3'-acetyltransferase
MLAHLLYQFILNSRNNPAFLFVILDEDVERIAIANQADKSCMITKINDRILLILNSFLLVFFVNWKQSIHKSEELYHTLVLSQVFMTFE